MKRKIMMAEALDRGDTDTAETIRTESPEALQARWEGRLDDPDDDRETETAQPPVLLSRDGPSDEVRKKLRGKRKKRH